VPWASPATLDVAIACPASCVLPRSKPVPDTPSQAWGHEVHEWKETGVPPTDRLDKWLMNYRPGIREELWPAGRHEVMFHEASEGEVHELPTFPKERSDHWGMYFIIDWVGTEGMAPHIDDLKTGRFAPKTLTQLLAYTWAYNKVYPTGLAFGSYTHWPRYPKGDEPHRLTEVLKTSEVEEWHGDVVIPAKRLAQGPGAIHDTRPGQHCRWCRSREFCPAWSDLLRPPVIFENSYDESRDYSGWRTDPHYRKRKDSVLPVQGQARIPTVPSRPTQLHCPPGGHSTLPR
jgi:hypothetical protein